MEHQGPAIFVALEQSAFAMAIRQSRWLYPLANVGHVIALVTFAGAIAVMDLRLIGALSATLPGLVLRRARGVAIAALGALGLSGVMLFTAEASHLATNAMFIVKQALVVAGFVNVALFEVLTRRTIVALPAGTAMPPAARIAGCLSLAVWIAVAACGRSIAYF
jgi:hypothetical protein